MGVRSNRVTAGTLDSLAEVKAGYAFRARLEHDPEGEVAIIQMKDVEGFDLRAAPAALRCTAPELGRHHLRGGDLVFRSRGRTNTCALVDEGLGPAVLAAPLVLIRSHEVLPAYLRWYINSADSQARLASYAAGTSVQMIPVEVLRAFIVPVPPPSTQQRIAELADLALRECRIQERLGALRHQLVSRSMFELLNNQAHS